MEFKGTRGEWVATEQSGAPGHCFVAQVFGRAGPVAQIEPTEDPAIATANARLIAAAPKLLLALQVTVKWMEWWLTNELCECEGDHVCGKRQRELELSQARAAIAKALGEAS